MKHWGVMLLAGTGFQFEWSTANTITIISLVVGWFVAKRTADRKQDERESEMRKEIEILQNDRARDQKDFSAMQKLLELTAGRLGELTLLTELFKQDHERLTKMEENYGKKLDELAKDVRFGLGEIQKDVSNKFSAVAEKLGGIQSELNNKANRNESGRTGTGSR
jgi:uncharacterized membrane-anchored protein YhcB (DUF1043 family)